MDAIVVGGGIAGLCCARELHARGKSFVILEASDRVGGRIATDEVDGFKLDRGFQVFLTAYPEAKRVLDYPALRLGKFEPGALVFCDGKFQRLSDPWRRPQHLLSTAISSAASFGDKLRIAKLRSHVGTVVVDELYSRSEQTTRESLQAFGFSDTILDRFFTPFLGGIFLEPQLATSSRMFEFVFRMFSDGDATLPESGMQAIPNQIAKALPAESIRLNSKVTSIKDQTVTVASGETFTAPSIVLAVANPDAASFASTERREACGVTCIYFAADEPPLNEAILVLNGEKQGPINNLCVPNLVCPSYAPTGKALISATVLGVGHGPSIQDEVQAQLKRWFGDQAASYSHLKTYEIPFALPAQKVLDPVQKPVQIREGLYRCSDDCDTASINGAMAAGHRAARAIT